MMLYLFLLLKSFKLETRFINIQQDTLTFTDLIPVEQLLKKISILFQGPRMWNSLPKDIKNAPSFSIFDQACDQTIFKGQTECNLITLTRSLYLYFPLNTLIYLNKRLFSLFLKMPPSI